MQPSTTQTRGKKGDNSTASNSSSSIIDYNLDILTLILTRLPLKSLLVCKSVSKQWYSLISEDPHFFHRYSLQNPRLSITGLLWNNYNFQYPEKGYISFDSRKKTRFSNLFRTLPFNCCANIIQSCNGLLLCISSKLDNGNCSYYIFNPFTNKRRILPRSQLIKPGFTYLRSASLAFDPLKSPYYKVIYFWCKDILGNKYRIEIFSSKNSCWKLCGEEYSFPLSPHKAGVFWNGSLSWIYKQGSLFYFDIDKELTAEVPRHLPDDGRYWETEYKIECFDTYKGHLRFIEVSRKASTFSVFHMDVEYTGWNLKYRVDLEGLKVSYPKLCSGYSVLYVVEREESPKLIVLVHDCKIISYAFHNMLSKEVYDIMRVACSAQKYSGGLYNVYKYMESLAHV